MFAWHFAFTIFNVMPPKGSKKLVAKHSFLGIFNKNKKQLNEMDIKIKCQEEEIRNKEKELLSKKREFEELEKNLTFLSSEINTKKRKLDHKCQILDNVIEETKTKTSDINIRKNKVAFQISSNLARKRKENPSREDLPESSKVMRRKETIDALNLLHGGTKLKPGPTIDGLVDTVSSKFKSNDIASAFLDKSKKSLQESFRKKVVKKWSKKYYRSSENELRSLNAYYSHDVLGKRKYLNLRKANSQSKYEGIDLPNYIQYVDLAKAINKVDIGEYFDISKLSTTSMRKVNGVYRSPANFILRMAKFYLIVNEEREDKLKCFTYFPKKDRESFLFALALGGDGAPGTGMAFLVSFLNVSERIASSKEQFLLFGGDVEENSEEVVAFLSLLNKDLEFLESKVFNISVNKENMMKVEFKVCEIPNDMKMLSFLGGELSNGATYFCTFANVNLKDSNDYKKTFGLSQNNDWRPFSYSKRLDDAKKVALKKKDIDTKNVSESRKRNLLTSFIASLNSRQCDFPLIGPYIDCAKAEPLHLKNNTVKERFIMIFKICVAQSNLTSVKSFRDIPKESLFGKFVFFIRKKMNCNFLAKKIERWFNDNITKLDKDFTFRFRGKESLSYLRYFSQLINMILINISDETVKKKLLQIHFQSIHLRKLLSYSVRITDFNFEDLADMKRTGKALFKACCLFDSKVSPSLWTLCNAAPVHAEICVNKYGFGLGCNTMEGREQKHQMIGKYAENTTVQNKWPLILRHEFIQLIHLRENGYDLKVYRKKSLKYVLSVKDTCEFCSLPYSTGAEKCSLCTITYF